MRVVELATGAVARVAGAMRMVSPDGRLFASHTDPHDEVAIARRESAGLSLTPVAGGAARLVASLAAALELHPQRGTIAHRHLYIKHPKWSPAGDRLFFVFTNEIHYERLYGEPRVKDIYTLDADGGNLRHVCSFPLGHHPSWHPDGRRILLNRRPAPDAPFQFLLVDAATGAAEVATDLIAGVDTRCSPRMASGWSPSTSPRPAPARAGSSASISRGRASTTWPTSPSSTTPMRARTSTRPGRATGASSSTTPTPRAARRSTSCP